MTATITAIETVYRGCRFRSRLEARWAVFFQTLGVPWEYEPEGFKLSSGEWYLPDFRVRLVGNMTVWCEVKPTGMATDLFDRFRRDKLAETEIFDFSFCMIVLREIPDPDDRDNHGFDVGWDDDYRFCICKPCGAVGFQFAGRSERINCGCPDKVETYTADHPRILAAYAAARSARFEHGENGEPSKPALLATVDYLIRQRDKAKLVQWLEQCTQQERAAILEHVNRRPLSP